MRDIVKPLIIGTTIIVFVLGLVPLTMLGFLFKFIGLQCVAEWIVGVINVWQKPFNAIVEKWK